MTDRRSTDHCLMVVRNEVDRDIERTLRLNSVLFDTLTVFDDCSTDNTLEVAAKYADHILLNTGALFSEDESNCREGAWNLWVEVVQPSPGDRMFVLDADEYLSDLPTCRRVHCHEMWGMSDARIDGFWGDIDIQVFATFESDVPSDFREIKYGCGRFPIGYTDNTSEIDPEQRVFHFGYLRESDRIAKHARYSGQPGHHPGHIASILTTPTLTKVKW